MAYDTGQAQDVRCGPRRDAPMARSADHPAEPVTVSLAAEAILLEERMSLLREAIDTVDAEIAAVSRKLRAVRADQRDRHAPS